MAPSIQPKAVNKNKIFLALIILASVIVIICSQKKAKDYDGSKDGCYGFPTLNAKKLTS